jgi:hypothetical protein
MKLVSFIFLHLSDVKFCIRFSLHLSFIEWISYKVEKINIIFTQYKLREKWFIVQVQGPVSKNLLWS